MFADRLVVQPMGEGVQFGEPVAAIHRANIKSEITDVSIRMGQWRVAQEQARRKPLDGAVHHAIGILRLDLAIDLEAQLGERAVGGENMRDVAEGVFVRIEPRVGGNVDAPAHHILAFMVARREPQYLDNAGGRRIVTMDDTVGDA